MRPKGLEILREQGYKVDVYEVDEPIPTDRLYEEASRSIALIT